MKISSGSLWLGFVVVLLGVLVTTNIVLMQVAGSDPSVATEPDYYRKAERWDERQAAETRSARLGWRLEASPRLSSDAGAPLDIAMQLVDAAGAPVSGASLSLEAFAVARSGDRQSAIATTDASGLATLRMPRGRPGRWELRLQARRDNDVFLATLREDVAAGSAR